MDSFCESGAQKAVFLRKLCQCQVQFRLQKWGHRNALALNSAQISTIYKDYSCLEVAYFNELRQKSSL